MRTRTEGQLKKVPGELSGFNYAESYYGISTAPVYFPSYYSSYKLMTDEIHPLWYKGQGGPMSIQERVIEHQDVMAKSGYLKTGSYNIGDTYECQRRAVIYGGASFPSDSSGEAQALGPSAWNRFKPKLTKVNLGQFLAELRDFPSLFKFKLKKFRDLGSGYLNTQFGWKPFISDLRRWAQSMSQLDRQLARLKNQNGKWIKRGGRMYDNESSDVFGDLYTYPVPSNYLYSPRRRSIVTTRESAWFSASFRYYIPGLQEGKWGSAGSNFQHLWGLKLTPSLVWELTPWSWLVDWVSDIGNVISNYDSVTFDNMAAKSAYLMLKKEETTVTTHSFTARYTLNKVPADTQLAAVAKKRIITKCRVQASPFGFNIDWSGFNPFQLSILSALGIQRFT